MREGNSPTHGGKAALAEAIASEGVIPLSVFVNFVSCISRHYSPQRAFLRTLRARSSPLIRVPSMFDVSRATSTTSESANSFSFFLPFFSVSTECSYSENLENLVETNVMSKTFLMKRTSFSETMLISYRD